MHAVVVVLGDLGRSPRIQYHVLSLLQAGYAVTFVGYTGEDLIPALQDNNANDKYADRFVVIRFTAPKVKILKTHALLFYYAWRIASLTIMLARALFWQVAAQTNNRPVDFVLVQNPPAIPLLFLATLYCRFWTFNAPAGRAQLVIDWHNVGYSMISLGGPVRAIARWYERSMAPYADAHFAVTTRMQTWLHNDLKLADKPCQVLHDSPPVMFCLRMIKEQHQVLQKYVTSAIQKATQDPAWQVDEQPATDNNNNNNNNKDYNNKDSLTLFTESFDGGRRFRPRVGRPALIVSSTSWTPDEDIQLLLDALQQVDQQIGHDKSSLRIVCAITGKGPLKEHYQQVISQMKLHHVLILTLWVRVIIIIIIIIHDKTTMTNQ